MSKTQQEQEMFLSKDDRKTLFFECDLPKFGNCVWLWFSFDALRVKQLFAAVTQVVSSGRLLATEDGLHLITQEAPNKQVQLSFSLARGILEQEGTFHVDPSLADNEEIIMPLDLNLISNFLDHVRARDMISFFVTKANNRYLGVSIAKPGGGVSHQSIAFLDEPTHFDSSYLVPNHVFREVCIPSSLWKAQLYATVKSKHHFIHFEFNRARTVITPCNEQGSCSAHTMEFYVPNVIECKGCEEEAENQLAHNDRCNVDVAVSPYSPLFKIDDVLQTTRAQSVAKNVTVFFYPEREVPFITVEYRIAELGVLKFFVKPVSNELVIPECKRPARERD